MFEHILFNLENRKKKLFNKTNVTVNTVLEVTACPHFKCFSFVLPVLSPILAFAFGESLVIWNKIYRRYFWGNSPGENETRSLGVTGKMILKILGNPKTSIQNSKVHSLIDFLGTWLMTSLSGWLKSDIFTACCRRFLSFTASERSPSETPSTYLIWNMKGLGLDDQINLYDFISVWKITR